MNRKGSNYIEFSILDVNGYHTISHKTKPFWYSASARVCHPAGKFVMRMVLEPGPTGWCQDLWIYSSTPILSRLALLHAIWDCHLGYLRISKEDVLFRQGSSESWQCGNHQVPTDSRNSNLKGVKLYWVHCWHPSPLIQIALRPWPQSIRHDFQMLLT